MSVTASTSGRINEEFWHLLFLNDNWLENCQRSRFNFDSFELFCWANLKGSIGFMLTQVSDMRFTIPLDLSFIYSVIHSVTTFYSHPYHNASFDTFYSVA